MFLGPLVLYSSPLYGQNGMSTGQSIVRVQNLDTLDSNETLLKDI